jgi:D-methionine transport system substrate-binding protein
MPTLYNNDEGDVVFINSNFAVDHDLNPIEDSIAIQDVSADSPYANLIVVRAEDEGNEAIETVVNVLREEATQEFILDTWEGSVVPVGAE